MHHLNLAGLISAFCVYEIEWLAARYGMRRQDLEDLRGLVKGPLPVRRGGFLCRQGERAAWVYAVDRGAFKTTAVDERGVETVAGLHLEGDFFGLEALADVPRSFGAEALADSRVFQLDAAELRRAMRRIPGLDTELMRLMSGALWKSEQHRLLLCCQEAGARLAAFILYLSEREASDGRDPDSVQLPMKRGDLAAYLGLAAETVSRLLARFSRKGLIRVEGRRVRVTRLQALARLAGRCYLVPLLAMLGAPAFL